MWGSQNFELISKLTQTYVLWEDESKYGTHKYGEEEKQRIPYFKKNTDVEEVEALRNVNPHL